MAMNASEYARESLREEVIEEEQPLEGDDDSFTIVELPEEAREERAPTRRLLTRQPRTQESREQSGETSTADRKPWSETRPVGGPPRVLIDDEIYYRVEGDLLLDTDELDVYQQLQATRQALQDAARLAEASQLGEAAIGDFGVRTSSLVGIVQGGKLVRWAPGTVLTYCVLRQTFPRDDWYEALVYDMQLATAAWEDTCGVDFEYLGAFDDSSSVRPEGVLFPVRHIATGGAFIAAAFFPHDPVLRRRVLIDPSYFTTSFDHVGVLQHELGHVLGFRHEHIRSGAPRVCPDEDPTGTYDLTAYDPRSVMHYFCGGAGSRGLAITEVDRVGSQMVYGPPLSTFEFREV